jgi:hypothetical protein
MDLERVRYRLGHGDQHARRSWTKEDSTAAGAIATILRDVARTVADTMGGLWPETRYTSLTHELQRTIEAYR